MFKYTRESIDVIINDIRKYYNIFKYGSLICTIAYFIYALALKLEYFWANVVLASLLFIYTLFEFFTRNKDLKNTKKYARRLYNWMKIIIKTGILGSMLYGIYIATTNVAPMSIILATLMIILWVLQVLLEIIIEIFENKKDLVAEAWKQDIDDIKNTVKKPINVVNDFVNRVRGVEVPPEPEKEPSRAIKFLKKRIKNKEEAKASAKEKVR